MSLRGVVVMGVTTTDLFHSIISGVLDRLQILRLLGVVEQELSLLQAPMGIMASTLTIRDTC
jgi:hypothetical protein